MDALRKLEKRNETNKTTDPLDGYVYVPAPGTLVQGEIDRARAAESSLRGDIVTENQSLHVVWANKMADVKMQNTARMNSEQIVRQGQMDALAASMTATMNQFKQDHAEELAEQAEQADEVDSQRAVMQNTLFQLLHGLAREDCPPPKATDRGQDSPRADGLPVLGIDQHLLGTGLPLDPLLNNYRFDTFEEAWRVCAETEGCSQVVHQEAHPLPASYPELTGYFLRRRLDPEKGHGYQFDLQAALKGQDPSLQESVILKYNATNYICLSQCPAACQVMHRDGGVACTECATLGTRACSTCDDLSQVGCSGNCPASMVDCRSCPVGPDPPG